MTQQSPTDQPPARQAEPGEASRGDTTQILVLADDFSGACEVSVPWMSAGFRTRIVLHDEHTDAEAPDRSRTALVRDTNSRYLEARSAHAVLSRCVAAVDPHTLIFKKIDSLWRGNVGAELAALVQAGFRVILAGALPHLERTVVNGQALIAGEPLAATDAWKVEAATAPARISDLLGGLESVQLARPALSAQVNDFQQELAAGLGTSSVLIIDCVDQPDLDTIAASWLRLRTEAPELAARSILVGTGALNHALSQHLSNPGTVHNAPALTENATALAVVGSASGRSGEQLRYAQDRGIPSAETAAELAGLGPGELQILTASRLPAQPHEVLHRLRTETRSFLTANPTADLFLTGGETARAVLDDLAVATLEPREQLEAGVVICQTPDGRLVGTKPGTFGSTEILHHALSRLRTLRTLSSQEPTQ
ncbi:four-carbon acid sugar kinase family protein [Glutamicibacter sp. NPDC087344]|uniref:four-carbon acid sugar kinase family protein n=1 Tax=Glutamicibacter sp. NPDC087344 TaxID=3363994 RepID=UPI003809BE35